MSKIILLDVDGVVGDLVGHTFAKLSEWFRPDELPPPEAMVGCHDLFVRGKTILTPPQLSKAFEVLVEPGFCKNIPTINGSQDAVKKLRSAGHQVVWLTAPWLSSPTWDFDRRLWLEKNFGSKQTEVVMAQLKELVYGHIFIDDKPSNLEKWKETHPNGKALLYDQIWNKNADAKLERFSWSKIDQLLNEV